MCGDWNVVLDPSMDNFNILHVRNPSSRDMIEEILKTYELVYPWHIGNPNDRKYTWRQPSPCEKTNILPGYRTDHSAIIFTFSASLEKRGKGYWKFNSQLLRDSDYVEKVKVCIKETANEYLVSDNDDDYFKVALSCDDQLFFEILKMKIRSLSIDYSIAKSRDDKKHIVELENDIKILENSLNLKPDDAVLRSLQDKKNELEDSRFIAES